MIWAWKCGSCGYLDLKYIVGVLHSGVLKALNPKLRSQLIEYY